MRRSAFCSTGSKSHWRPLFRATPHLICREYLSENRTFLNFRTVFWRWLFRMRCWLFSRFRCNWMRCRPFSRFRRGGPRRGFRMWNRLGRTSCTLRFSRRRLWLRLRLRMSRWMSIWRSMCRCRALISGRFTWPRRRLCGWRRMCYVRLHSRSWLGGHSAMLQFCDALNWPRHCGMSGNSVIR